MNSGIPLAMCFEKNHQCGRRSSAISSPSFSSFLGYGTPKFYARGPATDQGRTSPASSGGTSSPSSGSRSIAIRKPRARSACGNRSTSASCAGPVARHDQVRELVDQHVVEHPRRERREPRRDPDRAVLGRARTPPLAHVVDPAHAARAREPVLAREAAGARRDVDRGRVGAPAHAFGQLLRRDLRLVDRHPARERNPQSIADQHRLDVLASTRPAYELDLHVIHLYRVACDTQPTRRVNAPRTARARSRRDPAVAIAEILLDARGARS